MRGGLEVVHLCNAVHRVALSSISEGARSIIKIINVRGGWKCSGFYVAKVEFAGNDIDIFVIEQR